MMAKSSQTSTKFLISNSSINCKQNFKNGLTKAEKIVILKTKYNQRLFNVDKYFFLYLINFVTL